MDFVWTNTVIMILAFIGLYWLLSKYAFGPLMSVMEKRRELIQEQITTAEQNRTQAEQLLSEQRQQLDQARKDAYEIIEQSKTTSTKQATEIINTAKAEATRLKEEATKDIESEKNKAIASLRGEVGELSVKIASKIIEKQVDSKSQEQLVNQYLKEVGGRP
ncbi:ATP synthase F0 subunit B [Paenibacillus sp. 598K]|uniref:F0F1 ATP synthase subunit B n=1 Tax=Paenibacillus sp. 598K TaxID=1117987 RepID=UPI000FF9217C|nr:F0F1 ATP synthase subunit B [Paenibacillus sp. 598K]GBF74593.1 ATP synthase F0 subunit B [Paenibacillus sp. 598K]